MAKIEKTESGKHFVKQRGWGYEVWVENCNEYCGKVLVLKKGKKCSMHFHMDKKETMFLFDGKVLIKIIDPETGSPYEVFLKPGDSILIDRGTVHQIIAVENSRLVEFSTMHKEEDSYRIEKGS